MINRVMGKILRRVISLRERGDANHKLESYAFDGSDLRSDIADRNHYTGDLLDIYVQGGPQLVHKWHHYLPIYDRYFSPWRNRPLRFLEIGVSKGGSLSMWRKYFGADAVIFGIDIDEACRAYNGIDGQVRIGSQADPDFLNRVFKEMGGIDIVLDDGSHDMKHIKASLDVLLPQVTEGGIYMIEDLHTAYWPAWGGGVSARGNFYNQIREMIDDMHHWYHDAGTRHPGLAQHYSAIHIHDSICVLDKVSPVRPTHSQVQNIG